jgi:hypothetical protein
MAAKKNTCPIFTHAMPSGKSQYFLLTSDRHIDSPKSNRRLQKEHMEEAINRGAPIIDLGDMFDAMQGRGDKRSSKSDLLDALKSATYKDDLVDYAYNFLKPYAKQFAFIGIGNHETSQLKYHESLLIDNLCHRLKVEAKSNVIAGCYAGFMLLRFVQGSIVNRTKSKTLKVYYNHGSGGGAPVTRGIIKTNRRQVAIDADIYLSGHTHENWSISLPKKTVTERGIVKVRPTLHIQIPSYKEHPINDRFGFEVEREFAPTIPAAVWLRVWWHNHELMFDAERAW